MNYQDAQDHATEIHSTWKLGPTTQVWTKFIQHECAHTEIAGRATRNLRREPHSSMDTGTWFAEYLRILRTEAAEKPAPTQVIGYAIHPRLGRQIAYTAYYRAGGRMPRQQFMRKLGDLTSQTASHM